MRTNERMLLSLAQRGLLPPVPWWGVDIVAFPEPTRVAFAGCWHVRRDLVETALVAAKQGGASMLVQTGDFLNTGTAADVFARVVDEIAEELDLTVLVVRGNHDNPAIYRKAVVNTRRRQPADGFARLTRRILHAPNGFRWTWQGVEFVALGGAYSVDRPVLVEGKSYWKGEVASVRDLAEVKRGGHAQVMVTHDVPTGLHLPTRPQPDWWDLHNAEKHHARIRSAVDAVRPDWLVTGHMHLRLTDGLWLEGGHQVRVEVLDKIESGTAGNLFFADLVDGQVVPVTG